MKKWWDHVLDANVIRFFVTRKCQMLQQLMKIVNIDRENLHIFWRTWGILNEMFRTSVTFGNTKSHKKAELHPLSRRYIFGKTTGGVKLIPQHFIGSSLSFSIHLLSSIYSTLQPRHIKYSNILLSQLKPVWIFNALLGFLNLEVDLSSESGRH